MAEAATVAAASVLLTENRRERTDGGVFYPEGVSVPSSGPHEACRVEVISVLTHWFAERDPRCWVWGEMYIYYRKGDPAVRVAPDVFVVFGIDGRRAVRERNYRVWRWGGRVPGFVLEVASESTVAVDVSLKPDKYRAMGVEEYWRFDPRGGKLLDPVLAGDRLYNNEWVPIPTETDTHGGVAANSPVLGLDLYTEGTRLRFRDPVSGRRLLTPTEQVRVAEAKAQAEVRARRIAERRARQAEEELATLIARSGNESDRTRTDGGAPD